MTDFQKYKAQVQRVLSQTLYFMCLKFDGNEYYKIGTVHSTPVEDIKKNLEERMQKYFDSIEIKILGEWENRGGLKPYFYHRHNLFRCGLLDIPNILEIPGIFMFDRFGDPNYAKKVVREIKRIPLKYLSSQEQAILNGDLFEIEKKEKFSTAVKTGMQRAKHWGIHIGRPSDSAESTEQFLAKPKNKAIATVLKKGLSLRQTAKETGASVNTIRKVKAALEGSQS